MVAQTHNKADEPDGKKVGPLAEQNKSKDNTNNLLGNQSQVFFIHSMNSKAISI
jgi:hypothetical protein